jgi:hypothetical protein
MNTSPQRRTLIPRVARHFEFTRLQDQLIAIAYQALIPVVSRPLERPRSRCGQDQPTTGTTPNRQTTAGGA